MSRIPPRGTTGAAPPMRHFQILRTVTAAVSRSLNLNEVLQKSVTALTHVTGHEIASLHLLSADGETLLLRGERGFSDRLREVNEVLPLGHGLIGRVALTGRHEGPELDLAVPAIDRGADLPPDSGVPPMLGNRERAAAFARALARLT